LRKEEKLLEQRRKQKANSKYNWLKAEQLTKRTPVPAPIPAQWDALASVSDGLNALDKNQSTFTLDAPPMPPMSSIGKAPAHKDVPSDVAHQEVANLPSRPTTRQSPTLRPTLRPALTQPTQANILRLMNLAKAGDPQAADQLTRALEEGRKMP
jgi:hypothetical protein